MEGVQGHPPGSICSTISISWVISSSSRSQCQRVVLRCKAGLEALAGGSSCRPVLSTPRNLNPFQCVHTHTYTDRLPGKTSLEVTSRKRFLRYIQTCIFFLEVKENLSRSSKTNEIPVLCFSSYPFLSGFNNSNILCSSSL